MEKIEAKLVQGPALCLTTGKKVKAIMMTGGTTEIVEKNGRKVHKSTPWERQATPDDVLKWGESGECIRLTLNNGFKYEVQKSEKALSKGEKSPKKDAA
jgi:hypothetical protein